MEKLNEAISKLRKVFNEKPVAVWIAIAVLTLFAVFYRENSSATSSMEDTPKEEDSVDTFIPAGFVLVPIEVVNYESLDSVLGRYGVVDLFASDPATGGKSTQVASRIRILRAPRNPNQFAVLAPEDASARLVSHNGGFYVIIQNPQSSGTTFEKPAPKRVPTRRLTVEMSDE